MIKKIKKLKVLLIDDSLILLGKVRKSSLFRSAGVYTGSNILNSAIPFILLPVLTRYLSPEDYGIVAMFTMLTSITGVFIGLCINGAIGRQYYEKDSLDFPAYVGNCLYILIGSTIVVTTIFLLFPGYISQWTSVPSEWLWTVIVSSVAQFIVSVMLVLWQVQVKPIKYGLFQVLQTLFNLGLSVFFIVYLRMNWTGRVKAQVISMSLFATIALFLLFKNNYVKLKFNKKYIANALNFGVPLVPHTFGGIATMMTGRLLVTNMVGVADTGVYTVGVQIGGIIGLLTGSFNSAYVPWLFAQLKKDNFVIKLKIVKLTYFYYIGITILAIVFSLFSPWFLCFFLGKSFITASTFVLWIALGSAFNGMYYMVANYIFYAQKTHLLALITFTTAVLNIGITYLLIKLNGSIGAAQSITISLFVSFILTWIYSAKVYKMPWLISREKHKVV